MNEDFCTAVKILLQRMETHPEEFVNHHDYNPLRQNSKWGDLMGQVVTLKKGGDVRGDAVFLTDAELDALYEGYAKLRRKAFDDHVMEEVLIPEENEDEKKYGAPVNPLTGKMRMQGRYSTVDTAIAQHLQTHLEAERQRQLTQQQEIYRRQAQMGSDPYNYGGYQESLLGGIK